MAVQSLMGSIRGDTAFFGERLVRPELVIRGTTASARVSTMNPSVSRQHSAALCL